MSRVSPAYWWNRIRHSAMGFAMVGTAIRVGASLILLPLILLKLQPDEQALWWLFESLGNFAFLADFGFGKVISRAYSFLWAGAEDLEAEGLRPPPQNKQPNLPRIRQLNATIRYLYLRLSLGAMLLLGIGGTLFLWRPMASYHQPWTTWLIWAGYLGVVGYNLVTTHWVLAIEGVNRVRDVQKNVVYSSLPFLLVAGGLLICGYGLMSMVVATGLRALISRYLAVRVYRATVPDAGAVVLPDKSLLARLWPNARKFGILSIGGFLLSNANVLICGWFLPELTASMGLTNKIGNFMLNLSNLWLGVKWPQIAILRTHGDLVDMARLFARRLAFCVATFLFLAFMVAVVGNRLLEWKGSATQLLPLPVLLVFFAYLLHQVVYTNFGVLALTENVVPFFKVGLFTGITATLASLVATPCLGLWGMILSPFIIEAAYSGWFTIRCGFKGQPLTVKQLFQAALGRS